MIAVYAVRYSLEKQTFADEETIAALKELAGQLSPVAIVQIVECIDEADLDFDEKTEWLGLRQTLLKVLP